MKENIRTCIHKHDKYHHHHHGHEYSQPQEYSEENVPPPKTPSSTSQSVQQLTPTPKYTFEEQPEKFSFENQATTELGPPIIQSSDDSNF